MGKILSTFRDIRLRKVFTYMKRPLHNMLILLLVCSFVAPSVFMAVQPKEAHALTGFPATVGTAAIGAATTGLITCNLGGWITSIFKDFFSWFDNVVFVGATAAEADALALASVGAVGAGGAAGVTSGLLGAGASVVGLTVPVTDNSQTAVIASIGGVTAAQLAAITATTWNSAKTGVKQAQDTSAMSFQSCVLDPLVWMAKEIFIKAVTASIIAWIKGGFEGTPAFLQDPAGFFKQLTNNVVSAFLFESNLDRLLCSPFQFQIRMNFAMDYFNSRQRKLGHLSCSLDQMFPGVGISFDTGYNNITRSGNINFAQGGFPAVFAMAHDNNNPYGAYFEMQSAASQAAFQLRMNEHTLLSQNGGWFDFKCDWNKDGVPERCTPGSWISQQVDDWSNGTLKQLSIADEFAEIMNAIIQVLVQKVLEQAQGLLGGM